VPPIQCRLDLVHVVNCTFRSTPPSQPNKVGLKRPSASPSTKSFFDFNEI